MPHTEIVGMEKWVKCSWISERFCPIYSWWNVVLYIFDLILSFLYIFFKGKYSDQTQNITKILSKKKAYAYVPVKIPSQSSFQLLASWFGKYFTSREFVYSKQGMTTLKTSDAHVNQTLQFDQTRVTKSIIKTRLQRPNCSL